MPVGNEILGTATTGYLWPIINDYIIPGVQEQFYNQTFLLDQLKTSSKDVNGRQILIKHKLWRNRSARTFSERGYLGEAKSRGFKESSAIDIFSASRRRTTSGNKAVPPPDGRVISPVSG